MIWIGLGWLTFFLTWAVFILILKYSNPSNND